MNGGSNSILTNQNMLFHLLYNERFWPLCEHMMYNGVTLNGVSSDNPPSHDISGEQARDVIL
jgi:hypothetical protein